MSLEQALSQKLSLDNHQDSSEASGQSGGLSLRNIGRRHQSQSPVRTPETRENNHLATPANAGSPCHSNRSSNSKNEIPHPGQGVERIPSAKSTRRIFNNWRSACGRTKDKTKDFIRSLSGERWKTLPENHPDFDHLVSSSTPPPHGHNGPNHSPGQAKGKSKFGKKHSDLEINGGHSEDLGCGVGVSGPASIKEKSSAGWSVHVWATYVQRGADEDEITNEEVTLGRDLLSDFQRVKLIHFLCHVLDMNHDGVISAEDFVALNQRIRHYIEWSSECIEFHILKEVHSGFLECFLNQPLDETSYMYQCNSDKETREHVTHDEWLDVWGTLLSEARCLEDLPLWLQYFPKILFQVINKSGSGTISKEELRAFYTMFLGIDFRVVNETLDSIYNAMTDDGASKISYSLFKLCFANFLLAKYPHGPGQYLFGICSPQSLRCSFPIDYSALNTSKDDLEPYNPEKDKSQCNRRSVIV